MDGNTIRFLVFVSVFMLMLIFESFVSRHPTIDSKPRRMGIHLGLSGINTLLLKLVFGAAAVGAISAMRGCGGITMYATTAADHSTVSDHEM